MQSFVFRPRRKESSLSSSCLLLTRAFDLVNRSAQRIELSFRKSNTSNLRLLHVSFCLCYQTYKTVRRIAELSMLKNDGRKRLSAFWAPTGGIKARGTDTEENSTCHPAGGPSRRVNRYAKSIQEEGSLSRLISGGFVTQVCVH